MSDSLTPIKFRPGILKEQTPRAAEPYWIDGDKIRFRMGRAELIGGWQNITTSAATTVLRGIPRELDSFQTLAGIKVLAVGTHVGLFSSDSTSYYNITPVFTSASVSNIFSTSAGSTKVLVSAPAHGLSNETLVAFVSVTSTIGGNIVINTDASTTATYQVSVVGPDTFEIDVGVTAAATSAQTGLGGQMWTYLPAGAREAVLPAGWGSGPWGGGTWGFSSPAAVSVLRDWTFDLWGTELMANPTQGLLYIWRPASGLDSHAVTVTGAPSINNIVRVADTRQVFLYGTHDFSGVYDPLLIRWSSREDYNDWLPTSLNTAGEFRLPSRGSTIRSVVKMRDGTAILTTADLFIQNFIGGENQFGFVRASENCGVIGRKAAVEYNGILYWMSNANQFFLYNGRVESIPCDVLKFVFQNLNPTFAEKVCAGVNVDFNEIWWFYPDNTSTGENNRYVIYNILERTWSIGALPRLVWHPSRVFNRPIAAGPEGEGLYYHETGWAADTSALSAFVESAFFNGGQDANILFTDKIVPDFAAADGDIPFAGNISITLKGRKYPNETPVSMGPYNVNPNITKISTRLRAREFALRIASNEINQPWQMGEFSMTLRPDGKQ